MTAFDFEDLVDEFGNTQDVPWARHNGNTLAEGIMTSQGWTLGQLAVAAIFPRNPRRQNEQSEGQREEGELVAYVKRDLVSGIRMRIESQAIGSDAIEYEGAVWQATDVNDWSAAGGFMEVTFTRTSSTTTTLAAWVAAGGA